MADGLTNHSVDASSTRESVSAVEMFHLVERNLAGGGRRSNGRVSQGASLAQGEDSRGQAGFSHRDGDKIPGTSRQAQKPDAVADAPRLGRDLNGIDSAVGRRIHGSRQIRRALKVVDGKQDPRR